MLLRPDIRFASRGRRLAIVSLFAVAPLFAAAAADPPPVAPWEGEAFAADPGAVLAAAGPLPERPEHDVVVLFRDVRYTYDAEGREAFSERLVYRVLSSQAHESWSEVSHAWHPWRQERPELAARVITPDGAVHELDPQTIADSPLAEESPQLYGDGRLARAPLPAVRRGAVVEELVTVRERRPFFDRGVMQRQLLVGQVPTRHARLTLEVPVSTPLTWVQRLLPERAPAESVAGGVRRLVFEHRDLKPDLRSEPGLPAELPRFPHVAFATGASWEAIARRYSEVVDQAIQGAELSSLLAAARADEPAGSRRELIDRLLASLHAEVRYTGVELGEASIVPRPPAETLKRKYGDCKDQAALLTALLRASGVPAHVALLAAGDGQDVEASLPGFGGFNHAIVVVPGDPPVWIDPTDSYARAGELPEGDQGRLALVAGPGTTGLLRTPEATSTENHDLVTHELTLSELGPARLVVTHEPSGAPERGLRAAFDMAGEKMRESFQELTAASYLAERVDALEVPEPTDLARPFRVRLEMGQAKRGYTDMTEAAVGLDLSALLEGLPDEILEDGDEEEDEGGEERTADYVMGSPFLGEVRYRIVPPAGFAPRALPASRTRGLGPATLREEYAAAPDGTVTAALALDTGERRITAAELAAFRQAVRELGAEPPVAVWFDQVGEAHLAAGRVREALDEFRRLAAAAPERALPHVRLSRALLAGGMGEAAREEAQRAVALEPESATAHAALAWVLQHDLVGRRFGKGFDRDGALAASRKAKALAPEDPVVRGDLAILLEHDGRGVRYGAGADLAAAIEEYRALRELSDATGLDDNLVVALLRAGRFQEMRDLLTTIGAEAGNRPVLALVATAALDGPEAAMREADRRSPDPAARLQALRTAGSLLITVRRYPDAAALLAHAGKSAPDAAAVLALADLLRRTQRHEEVVIPPDRPSSPVRRLLVTVASPELDVGRLESLFVADMRSATEDEQVSADILHRAWSKAFAGSELPADVGLDLALAGVTEAVEGREEQGYKVRLTVGTGAASRTMTAFVVREDGEYRIAATEAMGALLGTQALRRLDAGDLAGGRQWLDWMREELPDPDPADPLAAPAFALLWAEGSGAGLDLAQCAAATLLPGGERATVERALTLLPPCRDRDVDPLRRSAFELALHAAFRGLDRHGEALESARRLRQEYPGSTMAFLLEAATLSAMRRWDEIRRVATERLAARPDDPLALTALAEAAMHIGDFAEMERLTRRLEEMGKADGVLNNAAWSALVRGKVEPRDVERAQRAAAADEHESHASLHTLAALYAEVGQTAEAYRLILQAIAAGEGEPGAVDWYVFGRLAEQYGLPDAARSYYGRVEKSDDEAESASTWSLAQRRLRGLEQDALAARPVRTTR